MVYTHTSPTAQAEPPTFKLLNAQLQFVTTPDETGSDIGMMRTELPPGATIPLHRHADPEIFYVLEGTLEVFQEKLGHAEWDTLRPGQTAAIPGGIKHAVRNPSAVAVICLAVTKTELYSFFWSLAQLSTGDEPVGPPDPGDMRRLFDIAERYGYWLATPEENTAIGISFPALPTHHTVR